MMLRLAHITQTAINPALAVLPRVMDSPRARVMMLAIGLQESRFEHRFQLPSVKARLIARMQGRIAKGPARGFWQFEEGTEQSRGGVWGVFLHRASNESLRLLCRSRDCPFVPRLIWQQIETDDVLAAGLARLLLWTDAKPLPNIGDVDGAWDCYIRNWRPGKPHPSTWPDLYQQAVASVIPATSTKENPA